MTAKPKAPKILVCKHCKLTSTDEPSVKLRFAKHLSRQGAKILCNDCLAKVPCPMRMQCLRRHPTCRVCTEREAMIEERTKIIMDVVENTPPPRSRSIQIDLDGKTRIVDDDCNACQGAMRVKKGATSTADVEPLLHTCGKFPGEAQPEPDVHTEHCCREHGCKYGGGHDADEAVACTVVSGKKVQSFRCEICRDDEGLELLAAEFMASRPKVYARNADGDMKCGLTFNIIELTALLKKARDGE